MKIVIDINEASKYSLTPYSVYHALKQEFWNAQKKKHKKDFWGMFHACDAVARELYSHQTGRPANVKNLILTYTDAERCFELFEAFASVWILKELQAKEQ